MNKPVDKYVKGLEESFSNLEVEMDKLRAENIALVNKNNTLQSVIDKHNHYLNNETKTDSSTNNSIKNKLYYAKHFIFGILFGCLFLLALTSFYSSMPWYMAASLILLCISCIYRCFMDWYKK